ncbi:PREDICTED: probable rhamnogalacturonate lyase B [Nelumbo nucifera]|uniref:rhamnogalacturonan endolyase n=2 Tax=Nelumbo nucifera TaxID=4432 RepID=A0A822Z7Q4_NELNU|nr:PREDICTED: probable rhamnogalacturonate lyase B [Nelumbo nucifera]DAD40887.1 TPA_asm: hypothetical protein HUJ06_015210 [Nelumbo nucifera]
MDNGILQVTLSVPGGIVSGIRYKGLDNLLEILNEEENRGYWDTVWNEPGRDIIFDRMEGSAFKVIMNNTKQIELSFTRAWNYSLKGRVIPLNIDTRFIMLHDSPGFYCYGIYEHLQGWPDFNINETRMGFKLRQDKFHYMAISDWRQRIMPMPEDRKTGQPLAYPEAVLLTHPINPNLKGEVDDKYQYSVEVKDNQVHGWISADPTIGFWMITPSNEFLTGGPLKQDLTSHVGPTTLSMFISAHYSGENIGPMFRNGEPWKKVFGPVFIYLNSLPLGEDLHTLWRDAKKQASIQIASWPYSFPASKNFPSLDQRGRISGRLLVEDRYISGSEQFSARFAYVGLAPPGDVGSWQTECKGYQFWTKSDANGYFTIDHIRTGVYNLYAWVPGFIGDYKYEAIITITPGCNTSLGNLVYKAPRAGPTLWEIGIPDRSASEFYVPDPNPKYINKLYTVHNKSTPVDKFRQYGLWERYADCYPHEDLVYTVGSSDYRNDWFFAHVSRKTGNKTYQPTTWRITFKLEAMNQPQNGNYTLRLALASATQAEVQVRFNKPNLRRPHFTTKLIGRDNAIARHGIHGLYRLFNITVRSEWLVIGGNNTIFLTQSRHLSPFFGVMYDYIRLEGPSTGINVLGY